MRILVLAATTFCGTLGAVAFAHPASYVPCPQGLSLRACVESRVAAVIDLERPGTLEEILRGTTTRFTPPNRFHQAGRENVGIHRVVGPNGERTLIKLIEDRLFGTDTFLQFEVTGMVLAESLGGPGVHRAGKIAGSRRAAFYVQMEEMFPDDPSSFTLKGLRDHPTRDVRPSRAQLREVSHLILVAMEQGVAVRDPDLLFGGGGVRWIDGGTWTWVEEDKLHPLDALKSYAKVFEILRTIDPAYAEMTLHDLRGAIAASTAWSPLTRHLMWTQLRSELRFEFRFEDAVLNHPRAEVELTVLPSLRERCEGLLNQLFSK